MDRRLHASHLQRPENMHPFETIEVDSTVVPCNGGGGPLGHPRVYLNLGNRGEIECPYCSRLFVLRGKGGAGELPHTPGAPGPHAPLPVKP
jgi:uncharacterized Zn-finger protein